MKWNPDDYAKHSDAQLKWAQALQQRLQFKGDETLLDLGCGDGKISAQFAQALPNGYVIGIDQSPDMVAYATQHYSSLDYPNLTFIRMDARDIQLDVPCDLVFSNAVLHWVDDHAAVLDGICRSLKPGGRLVISCGGQGNAQDILQVFETLIQAPEWSQYFHDFSTPYFFYSDRDYHTWLTERQFMIETLALVPKDMTHQGRLGLASWIRTTWMPFTERVPQSERDRFIQQFVDRYLQLFPLDDQGIVHVRMMRLEVDAIFSRL